MPIFIHIFLNIGCSLFDSKDKRMPAAAVVEENKVKKSWQIVKSFLLYFQFLYFQKINFHITSFYTQTYMHIQKCM